ncbi:RNA 2'-phosphotransferase [Vagococcus bubulae]|uniref:Probable RNA 2'-phosphotransferase n=1 Tax=Vagococcus bubulae TaxID=1977868 RepID=A0A429ZGD0_9ENTE|nr:RNA 2'-phosphotransferase [Vagococcus bubulae]RST92727.1 RNA 2'-phosphotransferase [Vagococcus bubulae]
MSKQINYNELSKEVSYALRHAPWEFELELDEEGWVPVNQLLDSLNKKKEWELIGINDLEYMIEHSKKKRHEMKNDAIRAYYGHSIPQKIKRTGATPPDILYHGTSMSALEGIKISGITPMNRQYVHLSEDIETALSVGKRKAVSPVILEIDTKDVLSQGGQFYLGNEKVWLSDFIPNNCFKIKEDLT